MRKIIHIDMDAFFASVEQRDFPELRGKPVAVGGSGRRGVVAAASYEARKYGVRSAMPGFKAVKLCPDLIFVKHRFDVYKHVSSQIHKIFSQYTDLIEPLSLDEAYLDVTYNKKGDQIATNIAKSIKEEINKTTGLTASAGVSFNKFLAKIASSWQKPNGLTVITPKQAQLFIDALPIEKFYGIGKVTSQRMKDMGIHKGKDLKILTEDEIVGLFGYKMGVYYYNIARAIDDREVENTRIRKSLGAEETLSENVSDLHAMKLILNQIADEVSARCQEKKIAGRTVTLKYKYDDFTQHTRSRTMMRFVHQAADITHIVCDLLHTPTPPSRSVRLLGITLSNLNTDPDTKTTAEQFIQLKLELQ
jgi:DNA polymerase-4